MLRSRGPRQPRIAAAIALFAGLAIGLLPASRVAAGYGRFGAGNKSAFPRPPALRPLPVVGEHAGEAPVLLRDLLDHDMGVFRLLAQDPDERARDLFDEPGLLVGRRAFGELQVYAWHRMRWRCLPAV